MKKIFLLALIIISARSFSQSLTVSDFIKIRNSDIGELTDFLELKKFNLDKIEYDTLIRVFNSEATKYKDAVKYIPPTDWKFKRYKFHSNDEDFLLSVTILRNNSRPTTILYLFPNNQLLAIRESISKNGFAKLRSYEENGEIVSEYLNPKYEVTLVNSPEQVENLTGKLEYTGRRAYYLLFTDK